MGGYGVSAIAEFAAALATVLAAWQLAPQVSKLRRRTGNAGLSPTWALLGVVTNVGWVAYRWSRELWFGVPSPVIAGILYGLTFLLIASTMRKVTWAVVAAVVSAVGLVASAVLGGWTLVGVVLGASGGAQAAPSVWAAFRVRTPSGIAPSVWAIGIGQAAMWGYYGSSVDDGALVLYGLTMGAASATVLARYATTRGRTSRAACS